MKTSLREGGRGLPSKLAAVLVCLWLGLAAGSPLSAQSLTGWLSEYSHPSYASVSSQFRMDQAKLNGQTYMGGSVNLFCSDLPGTSIDEDISTYPHFVSTFSLGSLSELSIWSRFSNTQNKSLALSMMHWLVDNYYLSHFLQPADNVDARRYAFQNAIWEVLGDGGTSSGLNYSTGNINRSKFAPGGSSYSATLWTYMSQMLTAVSSAGVTTSYQPLFRVSAVLDPRSSYQDYLVVPNQMEFLPVPEPSVAMLLAAAGALAWRRRR